MTHFYLQHILKLIPSTEQGLPWQSQTF